jgi:hypothetical protein
MRQFNFKRGEQAEWDKEPRFANVWLTKIPHTSPLVFHPAPAHFITLAESSGILFWEVEKNGTCKNGAGFPSSGE